MACRSVQKIKKVAIDVAKRSAVFARPAVDFWLDERMGGYQKRTAHIVTDPKVVLFSTFDGRGYSDSPKAIYEYMCSDPRFANYTFVWAFREPKKFTYVLDHLNTYIVTVNTRLMRKLAPGQSIGSLTIGLQTIFIPRTTRCMCSFGTVRP